MELVEDSVDPVELVVDSVETVEFVEELVEDELVVVELDVKTPGVSAGSEWNESFVFATRAVKYSISISS